MLLMWHEKYDFVKLTSQFWKKMHLLYSLYVLYKICLAWWWLINKVKTCSSISNKIPSYISCYNIIINLTHNGMSNLRIMRFQILMAVTMKVAVFLDWQHIMWWPLGVTCWLHLQYPKAAVSSDCWQQAITHHNTNSRDSHCRQLSWEVVKMWTKRVFLSCLDDFQVKHRLKQQQDYSLCFFALEYNKYKVKVKLSLCTPWRHLDLRYGCTHS